MNVLILTPDRVGSTLLQRLLTIYMLRKDFGRPVINLHELSNGLIKYYHTLLNQDVLGKPAGTKWGYYQTLPEVIELLQSVDHFKTSRLAHYHLLQRNDSIDDQIKFYEYINNNFYIISCRRKNLLEHVLSWGIQGYSKNLNVYSVREKIDSFQNIYKDGITLTKEGLEKYLNRYVEYINWSDTYFNVQSYFDYDTHIHNIEDYILKLDFMQGSGSNSWQDMFGQSFSDWNTCHRMLPNLILDNAPSEEQSKTITFSKDIMTEKKWDQLKGPDWPAHYQKFNSTDMLPAIKNEIISMFDMATDVPVTTEQHSFLINNLPNYNHAVDQINMLRDNGILVSGVPLKLQSLQEKQQIIKNFDQCVEWYNNWVRVNKFGNEYTQVELEQLTQEEEKKLNSPLQKFLTNSVYKSLGC
jgi:hypothetical protein